MRNCMARRGNGDAGCLVAIVVAFGGVLIIWAMLESATGVKSGWWGLLGLGLVLVVLFQWNSTNEATKASERQAEKLRREAEELRCKEERQRQWNSPEAVEQRRLEAERLRVEAEEKAKQRKVWEEQQARAKWDRYHRCVRIEEVDGMTGVEFETFIGTLFGRLGHKNVRGTRGSGDQGADVLCDSPDNKRTVVQTKRWKGRVGNSAIQEVMGALTFYDAELAFVITSSYFTDSAKALAKKHTRIHLVDRVELARLMQGIFPREVPEFDWNEYNEHVIGWREGPLESPDKRKQKQPTPRKRRRYRPRRW